MAPAFVFRLDRDGDLFCIIATLSTVMQGDRILSVYRHFGMGSDMAVGSEAHTSILFKVTA